MLYTNKTVRAVEKTLANGTTIIGITLGETGRGRKEVFLPLPNGFNAGDTIAKGMHPDLTIGFSRSGKPRINRATTCEMWVILYSYGNYSRRGDGRIYAFKSEPELYARGQGADGDAGRIGNWHDVLLKTRPGDVVRVQYSGYTKGIIDDFYVCTANEIFEIPFDDEVEYSLEAIGREADFVHYDNENWYYVIDDEWAEI